jgi:hypothetical protein
MYPSDLSASIISECLYSPGPLAPMHEIKYIAKYIRIRTKKIDRMRSEPVLHMAKILPAEAAIVRDEEL